MAYFTLQNARGYLHAERAPLNASLKAKAEEWANLRVDEIFFDWDRSAWDTTTPQEIADVAELLGSGKYLEMAAIGPGSDADPSKSWGPTLIEKGEQRAAQVRAMGGPFYDADRVSRTGPIRASGFGRLIDIHPT